MNGMLGNPLTHLGLGILAANRPTKYPQGLANAASGALAGLQSYQSYGQNALLQQLEQQQLENMQQRVKAQETVKKLIGTPDKGGPHPTGSGMLGGETSLPEVYSQMLSLPGYQQMGARGILSMSPETQKPTSLMQNVAAMGMQPGTPEYTDIMRQAVLKPQVAINQMPKPPTGYWWADPNNPTQGLKPIEGGPATKPSESEAKQRVQQEIGLRLLGEVDALVKGGQETGGMAAMRAFAGSTPMLSWAVELSPNEAKTTSNLEQFSNIMLAAMRGAQVGPAEQDRFERQLPRLGQDKALFQANMAASKKNLEALISRMAELRTGQPVSRPPPPPPGFVVK